MALYLMNATGDGQANVESMHVHEFADSMLFVLYDACYFLFENQYGISYKFLEPIGNGNGAAQVLDEKTINVQCNKNAANNTYSVKISV